jgi:hypothetical protein
MQVQKRVVESAFGVSPITATRTCYNLCDGSAGLSAIWGGPRRLLLFPPLLLVTENRSSRGSSFAVHPFSGVTLSGPIPFAIKFQSRSSVVDQTT